MIVVAHAALIAALCLPRATSVSLTLQDNAAYAKERPVMKVVRILHDMNVELQQELDDDKAVHAKLTCWCETNEKDKNEAVAAAQAAIPQLRSTMEEAGARMVELKEKRKTVMEELNAGHEALSKARYLRIRETKAFHREELDKIQAIRAIKDAIGVLGKHKQEGLAQVGTVIHNLRNARVPQLALAYNIAKGRLSIFNGFLQTGKSFLAIPAYQSYAPQSGQIFGILKQMQEEFESSLTEAQKTELQAQQDYEMLKAAKENEIVAAKKSKAQIDADLADFNERHALAAKELENIEAQLEIDIEFLANLKKKCSESEEEYESRLKSRLNEIVAVQDTIKILNSDKAFDVFGKSLSEPDSETFVSGTALLQTSAQSLEERDRRSRAVGVLRDAAILAKTPQLALLVGAVQLDAFTKVKEMIAKLRAELGKQQQEEVEHRDACIEELRLNDRQTAAAEDKKASLESQLADSQKSIEVLTAELGKSTEAIAEIQTQMKRASENREAENANYQTTIADQRVTQIILRKAIERMMQVFAADDLRIKQLTGTFLEEKQQPGAAHVVTSGTHTDPGNGPARFKEYEQHVGGKRVVALLETIVADSEMMENEAIASEKEAQEAYENFMKQSNASIARHSQAIMDTSEARAKTKTSLSMVNADFKQIVQGLEGLKDTAGDLHKSCDFVLLNFDARQDARVAEMDALKEAEAILSGMK